MVDYIKRSRQLRLNQTDAEKKIWRCLRNRQIKGIKFHRQYVIEPYICDFVARDIDLIIEIDGGQHNENKYDEKRDRFLHDKGYKILRYWNNDIMSNIEGVLEDIMTEINALTPALSLKGEGVLPTPKMERWKYSNLPAFVKGAYDKQPLSVGYDGDDAFVTPIDTKMTPWAQVDYNDMDLWADMQDVLSLHIPENQHIAKPISLRIDNTEDEKSSGAIHIHLGKNVKMTLYDTIKCDGWVNRSLTITLDEGAELVHIRTGGGTGVITSLIQIDQAAGSKYNAYAFNNYGTFVRDQIHARLNGKKAECFLSGAKILKDKNHCDTCILIEHLAPNCHSNQNYRNILDDASRGVFQGKVHVHRVAQQTDGYQLCNSILLSDKCEMDTKPELEIYADDVKCSHGAVTAQMDEEPLFYMMARGIPKTEAEKMMMHAFVAESLDALSDEEDVYAFLSEKLNSV